MIKGKAVTVNDDETWCNHSLSTKLNIFTFKTTPLPAQFQTGQSQDGKIKTLLLSISFWLVPNWSGKGIVFLKIITIIITSNNRGIHSNDEIFRKFEVSIKTVVGRTMNYEFLHQRETPER